MAIYSIADKDFADFDTNESKNQSQNNLLNKHDSYISTVPSGVCSQTAQV